MARRPAPVGDAALSERVQALQKQLKINTADLARLAGVGRHEATWLRRGVAGTSAVPFLLAVLGISVVEIGQDPITMDDWGHGPLRELAARRFGGIRANIEADRPDLLERFDRAVAGTLGDAGRGPAPAPAVDTSTRSTGKRDAAYWLARLERDAPDVAARFHAGKISSVRAACIEAGLIRGRTRLMELQNAWDKASPAERVEFMERHGARRPRTIPELLRTLYPDPAHAEEEIDRVRESFFDLWPLWGLDEETGENREPTPEQEQAELELQRMIGEANDPWPGLTGPELEGQLERSGVGVEAAGQDWKYKASVDDFRREYLQAGELSLEQKWAIRWTLRKIKRQLDISPRRDPARQIN